jgi:hypothetical protein
LVGSNELAQNKIRKLEKEKIRKWDSTMNGGIKTNNSYKNGT